MSVIDKIQINSTTYDVAAGAGNVAYSDAATYPDGSAGKEISQLKSDLDYNIGTETGNLFDGSDSSQYTDKHYWSADGTSVSGNSFIALNPIDVTQYDYIEYSNIGNYTPSTTSSRTLWLDQNGNVLDDFVPSLSGGKLDVYVGATQIAFSVSRTYRTLFVVKGYKNGILKNQVDELRFDVNNLESIALHENVYNISPAPLTWDWWFTNNVTDKYGNTYVGYIDKNKNIGVMSIGTDGYTLYHPLSMQNYADDHNPCGVALLSDGRLIVMSTNGHATKDLIKVFIADSPYTINCNFTNKSFYIPHPTSDDSKYYELTYAQVFVYNNIVYDFFRCTEKSGGNTTICYVKSSDEFTTFEFGVCVYSPDIYCKFKQTTTDGLLRMCITKNPVQGDNKILHGFLNLSTENLEDESGTVLGSLQPVSSSEWVSDKTIVNAQTSFTAIVSGGTSFKLRLLDVAESDRSDVFVIYGKSSTYSSSPTNFTYTVYRNGQNVELVESGFPFYKVSYYLPGCIFGWRDDVIFACSNEHTEAQDRNHVLRKITLNNNTIDTIEEILHNAKSLLRPIYSDNGKVIVSSGLYNDISGTEQASGNNVFMKWELLPMWIAV